MGKLEIKGSASKTVKYDLMKIELAFNGKADTSKDASEKVMRECEDFLEILKNSGFDISNITLMKDLVEQVIDYRNDGNRTYYKADRVLEIDAKFEMKMINEIRAIINSLCSQVSFHVDYYFSNEEALCQELLVEALKDAKSQAEVMAQAIDQKVVGLIEADKNPPRSERNITGDIDCSCLCCEMVDIEHYDNSDKLTVTNNTYTETIYTTWEIA